MSHLFKLAPLALALLALSACDHKPGRAADTRPHVLVSNPPTAWLVKQIAGDTVIVQTLASAGGCGHEYQPTDKEISEASKAQLWFTCGLDFETAPWAKGIAKEPVCEGAHAWMSLPQLARMAQDIENNVRTRLPALPPQGRALPGATTADALSTRHAHLTQLLAPLRNQAFLADHPAYTAFAKDYDLKQIPLEEDGHEATDAGLAQVIAQAKAASVKVLFLSSEEHRAEAEAVAKAVGAQVVLADPNSENTPELLEMMAGELVKAHSK